MQIEFHFLYRAVKRGDPTPPDRPSCSLLFWVRSNVSFVGANTAAGDVLGVELANAGVTRLAEQDRWLLVISMIKSYTCLLKDLEGERQEGKGEFQEAKMKTRATPLSSEAVCNLTTGSASLPLTEPGLFRKSLTESLSVPAAFETAFFY